MSTDRDLLDELFARTVLAHVGVIVGGRAVAMPTAFAVANDKIVIHGSTGSRWMRAIQEQETSVAITRVSGIVVARSMFESSILYQSAVLFGRFTPVEPDQHETVLASFTDRILPGRSHETRASKRKELAATLLLEMPISEWSLRISDGMPDDDVDDVASSAWGGIVTFDHVNASAAPSPDLNPGIVVPDSVIKFLEDPRGII